MIILVCDLAIGSRVDGSCGLNYVCFSIFLQAIENAMVMHFIYLVIHSFLSHLLSPVVVILFRVRHHF